MDRGLYLASIFLILIGLLGVWLGSFAHISESFKEMTPPSIAVLLLGLLILPIALFKGGKPSIDAYIPLIFIFTIGFLLVGWPIIFEGGGEQQVLGEQKIYLLAGDYWFNETNPDIVVYSQYLINVTVENIGGTVHTFQVPGMSPDTGYISPNQKKSVTFIAGQPGTYRYICTVPGHVELGMKGRWIVAEANQTSSE